MRIVLGELRSLLKKLPQHSGAKNLRRTKQGGEELPFPCAIPLPRAPLPSAKGGAHPGGFLSLGRTAGQQRLPRPFRALRGGMRAGMSGCHEHE